LSLVQINPKTTASNDRLALFDLGFRPFFLGAGVFSVLSIIAWTLVYSFQIPASTGPLSLFEWHAHQMIYGFSMAVIAGFLLTAILKWTNVETLHSNPLKLLFVCWAIPRVALLFGVRFIEVAALFDAMFLLGLCYGVSAPIVAVRQWKQIGILTKLLLLAAGNICFYLDAFNVYSNGAFIGVYGGLLLIISLILTIGGRVMPAFIKNSLTHSVEIRNPFWVTIATLILFLIFSVNILFIQHHITTGLTAAVLFMLTSYRLICWHTPGIWKAPLLWGLFVAYIFISVGFLLYALHVFASVSFLIAVHSFSYGGIGLATLSMMIRVTLGHTGRSIRTPPPGTGVLISCLTLGAIIRVFGPLVVTDQYRQIILASQVLWVLAFVGFTLLVTKMLISPRADGLADIPSANLKHAKR